MDFLTPDETHLANQLSRLAAGTNPGARSRILNAVRGAGMEPAPAPGRGFVSRMGGFGRGPRSAIALAVTFALTVPMVTWNISQSHNYRPGLSTPDQRLLGGVDESLASQISFDASAGTYTFNKAGQKGGVALPTDTYQLKLGADSGNPSDTYSVDMPIDPSKGFTYYDNHLQLSFTLIPEFPMGPAQSIGGRIVYPLENGGEAVYTVKTDGLQEDLIFNTPVTDVSYKYKLVLPDTLSAQSKDGLIGIYSADPSLFGNISFGSDADKMKVIDSRSKSAKTNIVFGIAAPTIRATAGTADSAHYGLNGDEIAVTATGLSSLRYPISLDPSVVVTSTADFANGNQEGGVDFGSNQLNRGALTGGVLGSWTANSNSLPTATYYAASAAYNGYVYELGGCQASCSPASNSVVLAPINSDGTVGAWRATTNMLSQEDGLSAVAYNGYLYELGGSSGGTPTTAVAYAPISAGGDIGAWTATTGLLAATTYVNSVAYNGYLYSVGGLAGSNTAAVDYAPIHADGSIGTWSATTSLPVATRQAATVVYNGYLYEIGGFAAALTAVVDYAPIKADGTLGTWMATTNLLVATDDVTAVAENGYLYEMGGSTGGNTAVVDFAQINANGTIGSWLATTSLLNATYAATSATYGGFVYFIGGWAASATTEVDYAQIQPAGTIGSGNPTAWTATTSLPAATENLASVAYNGFLYSIGGCTGTCASSTAVINYAPINAAGTIGSWTATTSLSTATRNVGAVAYNGYLYEVGGFTTVAVATVKSIAINANGTLAASWTATTSLPVATYDSATMIYNGYIYEVGGCATTCPTSVVYYATAGSGTIGTWNTTTALPIALSQDMATAYGGYIYEVGGCKVSACTTGNLSSSSYYAQISSNGTIGSWTASAIGLPEFYAGGTALAYDGFIYFAGGWADLSGAKTRSSDVYSVAIGSDGSITSWATNTSLPAVDSNATTALYRGFVYQLGGMAPAISAVVNYAPINNGGSGTVGSWTSTTALPAAAETAVATYNGYAYELGGCTATSYNAPLQIYDCTATTATVNYAQINADGTLGSWTSTTSLPGSAQVFGAIAYSGYLYEMGDSGGATAVRYAQINSNGTIGSWASTTSLPSTASGGVVSYNGYFYAVGTGTGTSVHYAAINTDGTVGTWTATTTLPSSASGAVAAGGFLYVSSSGAPTSFNFAPINSNGTVGSWTATTQLQNCTTGILAAYDGYVYEYAGDNGQCTTGNPTPTALVFYSSIGANGQLGPWTPTTSLARVTEAADGFIYNGYAYIMGGCSNSGSLCATLLANVDRTPINVIPRTAHYSTFFNDRQTGGFTSWNAATSLPASNGYASSVVYNGYVYEIGGDTGSPTAVVDYAPIRTDGTLGAWTATTSLPAATNWATSVVYNGFVYELGGCSDFFCVSPTAVVDYAPLNANGTVGTWNATTSLPTATSLATSVVYNGFMYELGGDDSSGFSVKTVDYAPINSNGTLGVWTATTQVPVFNDSATSVAYNGYVYEIGGTGGSGLVYYAPLNGNGTVGAWTLTTGLPLADTLATSVVYNGYLYEIGGYVGGLAVATVYYAPVNANGTIGTWTGTTALPAANMYSSAVEYNGYVYEIAGTIGATVYYAPIRYSIPIGTLVSMQYQGTLPGGAASISFETAGSNGLFTASAAASTVAQGNCVSNSIQYIWVRVTLDDSQAGAVFPDSTGTSNANLTSFTVNYMSHAPANQRLHGGKFFSNNVQSPLDTCTP